MARSASHWRADIEAYLVEKQLSTELADAVIGVMDVSGWSLEYTVSQMRTILVDYG